MRVLRQAFPIAIMLALPTLRHPLWHFTLSIIPASYFLIFTLMGGPELGRQALLGALVVFAVNAGIVSLPQLIVGLRYRRMQEMFVASPIGPVPYALGTAISRLLYVLPLIVLVLALLVLTGLPVGKLPPILAVLFVTWLIGSMLGFTVATYVRNPMHISAVSNLLGLLLTLIPPVYYPLSLVPKSVQWLALLVPTTHAAQLVRIYVGAVRVKAGSLALSWAVLGAYAALFLLLVATRARWHEP